MRPESSHLSFISKSPYLSPRLWQEFLIGLSLLLLWPLIVYFSRNSNSFRIQMRSHHTPAPSHLGQNTKFSPWPTGHEWSGFGLPHLPPLFCLPNTPTPLQLLDTQASSLLRAFAVAVTSTWQVLGLHIKISSSEKPPLTIPSQVGLILCYSTLAFLKALTAI